MFIWHHHLSLKYPEAAVYFLKQKKRERQVNVLGLGSAHYSSLSPAAFSAFAMRPSVIWTMKNPLRRKGVTPPLHPGSRVISERVEYKSTV
jgi:hypothetical protein